MVKIAVVQSGSILYDTNANIEKLREFSKKAAKEGVELILFPGKMFFVLTKIFFV
jgi:predicted amidohydrolase